MDADTAATLFIEWVYANPGLSPEEYAIKAAEHIADAIEPLKRDVMELEARLRPGVSDMLNRLVVADLAEISPTTGEIRFTSEGEAVIRSRARRPAVS